MSKPASQNAGSSDLKADVIKQVILSMGGKGGVGKTSIMTGLAEWFDENQIPVKLLDLDIENKARGFLTHFFGGRVPKININTPAGLDAFIDHLSDGIPVILADMGAGAGQITYEWFDRMYPDVAEYGIAFTAIGVVTADPASVESVLSWAARLQNRVTYLVVENSIAEYTDFTYWNESEHSPQTNSYCERLMGFLRRECLDFLIPISEGHLRKILNVWKTHYNQGRTHSSLGPGLPEPGNNSPVPIQKHRHQLREGYRVKSKAILGGLHHEYWLGKISA